MYTQRRSMPIRSAIERRFAIRSSGVAPSTPERWQWRSQIIWMANAGNRGPLCWNSELLRPPFQRDALDAGVVRWAPGGNIGIVLEGVVDDPALVGVHRFQLERAAGFTDDLGELLYLGDELIVLHLAPVLDVDLHFAGVAILRLEETIQEHLQIVERFAMAADKAVFLRGVNLERQAAVFVREL